MYWFEWIALVALAICLAGLTHHVIRLIRLGVRDDYSARSGSPVAGVAYSFTGGMDPRKKESAYLNLPTYASGVIFHIAVFAAIVLFFLLLSGVNPGHSVSLILSFVAFSGAVTGIGMLTRRFADKKLRYISNADDHISLMLVVLFLALAGFTLFFPAVYPAFMLASALLLLYMPLGKLRHAVYFFAARIHLGRFYGWRNVWPPRKA
ncbi:MAG: hypothetical protein ACLFS0_01930 [Bacteroidales bacterium]